MATAYLTKDNFKDRLEASKKWMGDFHKPLSEYARIARNKPYAGIDKKYPKNTDGTVSAVIAEAPKRQIQQLPTGKVEITGQPVKEIIAGFILENTIIPNAVSQAPVHQKAWGSGSKSYTYGSSFSTTFFTENNGVQTSDFKIVYIKDVFGEAGKLTAYEWNYCFIRAWHQPEDIDSIIDLEESRIADAKENGYEYTTPWNIANLKAAKDWYQSLDQDSITSGEGEAGASRQGIEIMYGFQNGIGNEFLFYATGPELFVYEEENPDARGVMPVQVHYCDIDFENPLGRGIADRAGGTQNVIDSMLQSYQYMRGLSMNPPVIKRGKFNKSTIRYENGVVWDLGDDPKADIKPVQLSTDALNNFVADYGLFKSQIIALTNNGDTSVSAEVGNPGFSKTTAGVQSQQLKLGVSDNYGRKQAEAWLGDVFESLLNIYFANMEGKDQLQLDEAAADKLRDIDPTLVDDDNMTIVDYSEYTELIRFHVDASSSAKQSEQEAVESLDNLMERIGSTPVLLGLLQQYPEKIVELYNQYVKNIGVIDGEKLQIDVKQFLQDQEDAKAAAAAAAAVQAGGAGAAGGPVQGDPTQGAIPATAGAPAPDQGAVPTDAGQLTTQGDDGTGAPVEGEVINPGGAQIEDPLADGVINDDDFKGLAPEEVDFITRLIDRGYPDRQIAQAIVTIKQGGTDEDVIKMLDNRGDDAE